MNVDLDRIDDPHCNEGGGKSRYRTEDGTDEKTRKRAGLKVPCGTYSVQFEVESACVAHGLALVVPPPQRRRVRVAVGALQPGAAAHRLHDRRNRMT